MGTSGEGKVLGGEESARSHGAGEAASILEDTTAQGCKCCHTLTLLLGKLRYRKAKHLLKLVKPKSISELELGLMQTGPCLRCSKISHLVTSLTF